MTTATKSRQYTAITRARLLEIISELDTAIGALDKANPERKLLVAARQSLTAADHHRRGVPASRDACAAEANYITLSFRSAHQKRESAKRSTKRRNQAAMQSLEVVQSALKEAGLI